MAIRKLSAPPRELIKLGKPVALWLQELYLVFNESSGIELDRVDVSDPSGISHNGLGGIQGGAAADYQHLTSQEVVDSTSLDALVVDSDLDFATYDLFFSNDGGLPHGSMYMHDGSVTVTVSATDTWYRIGSGFTVGQVNLATFQNAREIAVTRAGRYKIDWSISFTAAAAAQEIEGTVMINNVGNTQASAHRHIQVAAETETFSGSCILDLSASDVVALGVLNETATQNITIEHANLSLVMVGG
jgi:hypothetical protein